MKLDLSNLVDNNDKIAVALSGGSDSMALLHYLWSIKAKFNIQVLAINVEHGIRGAESISDSEFCKNYCEKYSIPFLSYSVDSINYALENKLSIEQSARILRYNCFYDAITSGKCNKIATAHHLSDNAESILFNLLRGTGLKGAIGIEQTHLNKIIRPLLHTTKSEINDYIAKNHIPFVVDGTNFDDNYTRNNLRLNVIPKIKEIFPEFEESLQRFSLILGEDLRYLEKKAKESLILLPDKAIIPLPQDNAILSRQVILSLNHLGVEKDWEKAHVDACIGLKDLNNGDKISLPKNLTAIKEYDKLVLFRAKECKIETLEFNVGEFNFLDEKICIKKAINPDLKNGLFADLDKIPEGAVIRTKQNGDIFTKFNGGTKSLADYLTDKKIPRRIRDSLPLLCLDNRVLAIFGIAISDNIKVDENTVNIIEFEQYNK